MRDNPGTLRRFVNDIFQLGCAATATEAGRRSSRRLNTWSVVWALSHVAATWFLTADYNLSQAVTGLLIVVPLLLGTGTLHAYLRFLRDSDEMIRKIHLDALAIGFGIMLLAGFAYALLHAAGAPPIDVNLMIALAIFAWVFGILYGLRRYQ